jgi:sugar phosphate isomerase/epimerase
MIVRNPVIVSTAAYDGYDWETIFKSLAGLEVELVELAFIAGYTEPFSEDYFSTENAEIMKGLLTKYHLRCCSFSSHVDLGSPGIVDVFKKRMAFAREIGATTIVSNASVLETSDIFYFNIGELADYGAELQLKIGLENPGDGRPNVINHGEDCQQVIDRINSPWVGVNYDFGNLVSHCLGKIRPELDYLACKKCTVHYHIKDVAKDGGGYHFTPIGQGLIDYRTILHDLADDTVQKPLSLEIPLRLRRDDAAQPIRSIDRIVLDEIESVLQQSLEFVLEVLSSEKRDTP